MANRDDILYALELFHKIGLKIYLMKLTKAKQGYLRL